MPRLPQYAQQAIITGCSVLMAVCSWLAKDMVSDIRTDVKTLSQNYYQLREEKAALAGIVNLVRTRQEICEATVEKLRSDFHGLEVRLSRGR